MANQFTKKEKFELFLNREGAFAASRVLTGGVLGSAMALEGSQGLLATAGVVLATSAFNAYACNTIQYQRKKLALELYREEIASVQGKRVAELTLDDLEEVARPVEKGGKGIIAIRKALNLIEEKRNLGIGAQMVTTGIMLAGLAVLGGLSLMPDIGIGGAIAVLGGASSLLYNEVYKVVDAVTNILYDMDDKKTVTRDIRAIADQIGLGGRVSSTRVLGVFVEANPGLDQRIKEKYGDDYFDLTIAQKRQAVKEFDEKYNIKQLTSDINTGCINPTELAFLAYGQKSGVKRCDVSAEPTIIEEAKNLHSRSRATFIDPTPREFDTDKLPRFEETDEKNIFSSHVNLKRGLFTERLAKEQRWRDAQLG